MTDERRRFNRVEFKSDATIFVDSQPVNCEIIDISLAGTLLKLKQPTEVELGTSYTLDMPLDGDENVISMQVELVNQRDDRLGLKCSHIDLDSITLLRRLVELNLGQPELLERDFASLVSDNE
ncbi:MAG: PilZ domain-containing protein [Kangiellaceae bacterium]|nr:PilZ domain-containing protein [Kangiellaceae bacterium]MCW9000629.1 PilZ domain-containing protein [Kangiellaceae bacterium]MCW9015481.1 PilZ domain-containing protein [Kangiellaceae bacterium]